MNYLVFGDDTGRDAIIQTIFRQQQPLEKSPTFSISACRKIIVKKILRSATRSGLAVISTIGAISVSGLAIADPPVTSAGTTVSGAEKPGNISSIIVPQTSTYLNQNFPVHVMGGGKTCRYHLVFINLDNNQQHYFSQTSKLPALVHVNLAADQFSHGRYKVAAMVWDSDKTSGTGCQGGDGAAYAEFKIERQKITLSPDTPTITGLIIKPGKSPLTDTFYANENIGFSVNGNVSNQADVSKKCGWTLLITDSNGTSTDMLVGSTFESPQITTGPLALKPGQYTLTVKTTPTNISVAPMPCLGKSTKPITIAAVPMPPGKITDVALETWGVHGNSDVYQGVVGTVAAVNLDPLAAAAAAIGSAATPDHGVLRITPKIDGASCGYEVLQMVNDTTKSSMAAMHQKGYADKLADRTFKDDQTTVQITIQGGTGTGACTGSITKTISVHDDPKLPKVSK